MQISVFWYINCYSNKVENEFNFKLYKSTTNIEKTFCVTILYHARFYLEMETQKFDWENLKISISTSNFKYYFNTYYYLYVTAIITSNIDHVFHNVCLPFLLSEKCLQIALLEVTQLHCIDPPICAALIKSQKS